MRVFTAVIKKAATQRPRLDDKTTNRFGKEYEEKMRYFYPKSHFFLAHLGNYM